MSRKINYFLVDSPLQLINAEEAKFHYDMAPQNCILIILEGVSKKNLEQIKNLARFQKWKSKIILRGNQLMINRYIVLFEINKILKNNRAPINYVVIGEYRSDFMRHFANKSACFRCIALDDGNVSMMVQKRYFLGQKINKLSSKKSIKHIGKKVLNSIFNVKDSDVKNLDFFTIYPYDTRPSIVLNNYSNIKTQFYSFEKLQSVYFIGNNTPEMNIIDQEIYLKYLENVKKYYSKNTIIYIPHRRENKDKLEKIENKLKMKVRHINYPVELSIIFEKKIPSEIASFFSSALDNCYKIFGYKAKITSFQIDPIYIVKEKRERVSLNYEQYKKYDKNFHIVKLNINEST